ncbi:hypothetical protein C8R44DRAFT_895590 [Mycena epipterygia]|nr:hypothetical protein C8R44DRAFT_895590 [Mycena epipterygia]
MSLEQSPTLPRELERQIFETTASIHPRSMPALILVAQRVKIWIGPLLYRVLHIGRRPLDSEQIWVSGHSIAVRRLMEARPPAFFHDHVRHLCLDLHATVFLDDSVLVACDATVNVHLAGGNSQLLPQLAKLPLRRLSVDLKYLFPRSPDFRHALFATITHLSLHSPNLDWPQLAGLVHLPCLTHLSLDEPSPEYFYQNALRAFKSLAVLAVSWSQLRLVEALVSRGTYTAIATDPRFVVLLAENRIRDWDVGAQGGNDYWARADELVRKRRSGETSGKSFIAPLVQHIVIIHLIPEYYLYRDD